MKASNGASSEYRALQEARNRDTLSPSLCVRAFEPAHEIIFFRERCMYNCFTVKSLRFFLFQSVGFL